MAPGKTRRRAAWAVAAALAATTLFPGAARAHVKWFAEFGAGDPPAPLSAVLTPTFFVLAALSTVAVGVLALLERRVERAPWYLRVDRWLAERADQALLVLRVTTGATLLLSWQSGAMLAPELEAPEWVGWYQFALALLLLFGRTVPVAGAGLALLYAGAVARFGLFHMLDYLHHLGIAWYLAVAGARAERLRESRIPALYLTVGFALAWLALEKVVYPQWTAYILEQNPQLALGLDPDFFRVGAAFVEFTLGYLFIINLFERPIAALVTLVFFTTTLVFGKVEVIGHTAIHGALIVFLLEGQGRFYRPPIELHRRLVLRSAFASVNYALLLAAGLAAYHLGARRVSAAAEEPPAGVVAGPAPRG
jgi:hypothetical protein